MSEVKKTTVYTQHKTVTHGEFIDIHAIVLP
jgi:hypothetical protein